MRSMMILATAALMAYGCGGGPDDAPATPATTSTPTAASPASGTTSQGLAKPTLPPRGTPMAPTVSGRPDGAPCGAAADCQSGVCEGQGCGGEGPVCKPIHRMCTKDLRAYCGCDGATFMSSGSCPGRPYKMRGDCAQAGASKSRADGKAAGERCVSGKDCASGVCEGQGCNGEGSVCAATRGRMCTKDLRRYCGCNGVTFRSSGSCPGRPFAHKGACKSTQPAP